jgi:hypothetical protein
MSRGAQVRQLHPTQDAHESGTFLKVDRGSPRYAHDETPESGIRVRDFEVESAFGEKIVGDDTEQAFDQCDNALVSDEATCRTWTVYRPEPSISESAASAPEPEASSHGPLEGLRWICQAYAVCGLLGAAGWAGWLLLAH